MADDDKKLGKAWKGQTFVPIKTAEDVAADAAVQAPYEKPNAVTINVYFSVKGIRDPVHQAGMRAYTRVQRATLEDWAEIFKTY